MAPQVLLCLAALGAGVGAVNPGPPALFMGAGGLGACRGHPWICDPTPWHGGTGMSHLLGAGVCGELYPGTEQCQEDEQT